MRRRHLVLVLVLLLLVAAAAIVQRILFPPIPKTLQVLSVRGEVTVVDPVKGNSALQAGARISPGDAVRTGHEGEAVLQGNGNSTITLSEHASVKLEGVTSDGVSKIALESGRVRAVVPEGSGGGVEVSGGRDKASVLTRGGDVAVGIDGRGDVSVATFQGKASLTHGGTTKDVAAGQLAVVSNGKVRVGAIPTQVLLKVAWPEGDKTNDPVAQVNLEAPPGATVRVEDRAVTLDSSGHAMVAVTLKEGENRIHLEAQDVAGNHRHEESGTILLDTSPPQIKSGKPHWK